MSLSTVGRMERFCPCKLPEDRKQACWVKNGLSLWTSSLTGAYSVATYTVSRYRSSARFLKKANLFFSTTTAINSRFHHWLKQN